MATWNLSHRVRQPVLQPMQKDARTTKTSVYVPFGVFDGGVVVFFSGGLTGMAEWRILAFHCKVLQARLG